MSDRAAEFHAYIRQQESVLLKGTESIQSAEIPLTERQKISSDLSITLSNLNSRLADIARDLPNHDVKVYTGQIKDVRDKLATAQAGLAPKSKFSFKNKRSTTGTNASTPRHETVTTTTASLRAEKQEFTSAEVNIEDAANLVKIENRERNYASLALISTPTRDAQQCIVSNVKSCLIDLSSNSQNTSSGSTATTHDRSEANLASLTITSAQQCLILAPHVDGPVHVTGLNDCALFLNCRQLRMHDSNRISVYLVCSSRPIIEGCRDIQFAPLSLSSEGLFDIPTASDKTAQQQQRATNNLWSQVDDFKWLKSEPSPSWYAVDERELELEQENGGRMKQIEAKIQSVRRARDTSEMAAEIDEVLKIADFRSRRVEDGV